MELGFLFNVIRGLLNESQLPEVVFGGLIVGVLALVGVFLSFLLTFLGQVAINRWNRQSVIRGVLQALCEELKQIEELYHEEIGVHWGEVKKSAERIPMSRTSISQDYFTMYSSNANLIGQIPASHLRREIVRTYTSLKGLLDCYGVNNILWDRYEEKGDTGEYLNLLDYAQHLEDKHERMVKSMKTLIHMLQREISLYGFLGFLKRPLESLRWFLKSSILHLTTPITPRPW